ncbi:hypothetical protein VP01_1072g1 [Puccinia sorghi]|uniref:Uncharacterized protein n=1 Tax=Puccinia sorghi TaxID=27349 RepID=A0A0L6VTN7_9BASI|nr:hypothetical protein VP01_1072g1 [Puccinia sorghi]
MCFPSQAAKYSKCVNALITFENVHSTSHLTSISTDWLNCTLAWINQDLVKTKSIGNALKNKYMFSKPGKRMVDLNRKPHSRFPWNFEGHDLKH